MNERLKEIVKQARLPACHLSHPVALERFAELVRQDERALANPDLSIEANRVAYDVAMHYANKTKEKNT